ncbi:MAG TPA: Uma2 family endonuclease [Chthonomonadaceae bacterium]|nr:Uma2 family endonuclease [Chthonomonadaceae bacterium]
MAVAIPPATEEHLTFAQYIEGFDLNPPTTQPYEILDGVVHMVQTPNWRHQRIVGEIYLKFRQYENSSGRGMAGIAPFDVVIRQIPKLRTRQPDVCFISHERLKENQEVFTSGPLLVAPELVVEILSQSETPRSIQGKIEDFRSVGVLECWIVSPEAETIQVLLLKPEGIETGPIYTYSQTLQSVAFPDLAFPVADLFGA